MMGCTWQAGTVLMLRSPSGNSTCVIDPDAGGRIESLLLHGLGKQRTIDRELLLTRNDVGITGHDPFAWGCFVMAPYCGRVRNGMVNFADQTYELPRTAGNHAIHGTVIAQKWVVLRCTDSEALLACELGPMWPFEGSLHHEISLSDHALTMTLTLCAQQAMPAQIGWHPWFRPPDHYTVPFTAMLKRGPDGIATDDPTPFDHSRRGDFDDCFIEPVDPIVLRYPDYELVLASNCSHWVVFDQHRSGICFEPQSGPPNGVNTSPDVLSIDDLLSRQFEIGWRNSSDIRVAH